MSTLAIITSQLEHLCQQIEECDHIPDDLLDLFSDTKFAHETKVQNYVHVINTLQHNAAFYAERAETLKKRAKTCERLEKEIKDRLLSQVETHPNLPWKSQDGDKISVRKNPESLKLDMVLDKRQVSNILPATNDIDPKYIIVFTANTLNTDEVKKDLRQGVEIPWARLDNSGRHLRLT